MYKYEIQGCLSVLFVFLIFLFLVKELWPIIAGIIIVVIAVYYINSIYKTLKQKENKENYNPKMGEVYKICPYCNTKVRVTQTTCPNCSRALN